MRKKITFAALAALVTLPTMVPIAQADARDSRYEHRYRGSDGRYHYRCKRSSGTTGLIAGGAGGALAGNALGGGALGTIAGGVGGALLGKHLDKRHDAAQNRRNGC